MGTAELARLMCLGMRRWLIFRAELGVGLVGVGWDGWVCEEVVPISEDVSKPRPNITPSLGQLYLGCIGG